MLNFSINFLRLFLIIYIIGFTTSCAAWTWWTGPTKEQITEEIDANKDGIVSKEEIKSSKYDINKDGELSQDELIKAMKGNSTPEDIASVLAALNIPFAGGLALALRKVKEYKKHLNSVAGGIEDLVHTGKDGFTKEELYACTTCNACVEACPVLINPLEPILEMRRYDILTNSSGPQDWLPMFNSIESSGAVWSLSEERAGWTKEL